MAGWAGRGAVARTPAEDGGGELRAAHAVSQENADGPSRTRGAWMFGAGPGWLAVEPGGQGRHFADQGSGAGWLVEAGKSACLRPGRGMHPLAAPGRHAEARDARDALEADLRKRRAAPRGQRRPAGSARVSPLRLLGSTLLRGPPSSALVPGAGAHEAQTAARRCGLLGCYLRSLTLTMACWPGHAAQAHCLGQPLTGARRC